MSVTMDLFGDDLQIETVTSEDIDNRQTETHLNYEIYNSLRDHKDHPVNEIIGWSSVKEGVLKTLSEYADPTLPQISYQVSMMWQSTTEKPKPEGHGTPVNAKRFGSKYAEKIYDGIGWHTVTASINTIIELVKRGYCLRYGIKEGSNDLRDFKSVQVLAFDLDADPNVTWQETRDILYGLNIDPLCIYYSPSGNEDNNKLRALIALDQPIYEYDQAGDLLTRICQVLPNATSFNDSTRLWYGTIRDIPFVSEEYLTNPVSRFEEFLPEKLVTSLDIKKDTSKDIQSESNFNKKVYDFIFHEILIPNYNGDLSAMVDGWIDYFNVNHDGQLFKGEWIQEENDGNGLMVWNGTNPIRGGTGSNGVSDSFTVSIRDDYSLLYSIDHSSKGNDIVSLFYHLREGSFNCAKPSNSAWTESFEQICALYEVEPIKNEKKKNSKKDSESILFCSHPGFVAYYDAKCQYAPEPIIRDPINFEIIFGYPKDDLRFVQNEYYRWNGKYWEKTKKDVIDGAIREFFADYYIEVERGEGSEKPNRIGMLTGKADRACKELQFAVFCDINQLKHTTKGAINLKNGILVFEENGDYNLVPHNREFWFNSIATVAWKPEADTTEADRLLMAVKTDHLETFMRLIATSLDVEQAMRLIPRYRAMFLIGEGSNGKDAVRNCFRRILGKFGNISLDAFKEHAASNRQFQLSKFDQHSIHWTSESHSNIRLASLKAFISAITGGELEKEFKGKDSETISAKALMIFNINTLPIFDDKTFITSRFCLIDFDKSYAEHPVEGQLKADPRFNAHPDYADTFLDEEVCPGLLKRLVEARVRFLRERTIDFSFSTDRIKQLAQENDQWTRFINFIGAKRGNSTDMIRTSDLYVWYRAFCVIEERAEGMFRDKNGDAIEVSFDNWRDAKESLSFEAYDGDEKGDQAVIMIPTLFTKMFKKRFSWVGSEKKSARESGKVVSVTNYTHIRLVTSPE